MHHDNTHAPDLPDAEATAKAEPSEPTRPWHTEVNQLMQRAAALCIEHGVDADTFMSGAWSTYIERRPDLRDQLEEAHLTAQLDELRKLGRMGEA